MNHNLLSREVLTSWTLLSLVGCRLVRSTHAYFPLYHDEWLTYRGKEYAIYLGGTEFDS
jgi:hypothetical protein